jgi:hypothetical protein
MKLIRIIFLTAAMFCITACGPAYKTVYHYKLPKHRSDRHCVASCRIALSQCQNSCRAANQNCQNQQLIADDIASRHRRHHRDDNFYQPSYDCNQGCNCRASYNDCYTDCGGEVDAQQVCIFNCPAIVPEQ